MKVYSVLQTTRPKLGGQHSIGLFGVSGFNAPRHPLPRVPKASRIKGALNSFDSDGLTAAHYAKPAPAPVARPAVDLWAAAQPTTPAMRAAACASDERERWQWTYEDEQADFWHRCSMNENVSFQTGEVD